MESKDRVLPSPENMFNKMSCVKLFKEFKQEWWFEHKSYYKMAMHMEYIRSTFEPLVSEHGVNTAHPICDAIDDLPEDSKHLLMIMLDQLSDIMYEVNYKHTENA